MIRLVLALALFIAVGCRATPALRLKWIVKTAEGARADERVAVVVRKQEPRSGRVLATDLSHNKIHLFVQAVLRQLLEERHALSSVLVNANAGERKSTLLSVYHPSSVVGFLLRNKQCSFPFQHHFKK